MVTYNSLAHATFGPVETPDRYYFAHVGPPAVLYGPRGEKIMWFSAYMDAATGLRRYAATAIDGSLVKYSYNLQELVDHICRLHRLGLLK